MIKISANSQFAPHVLEHGGDHYLDKDGKEYVIAGMGKTVAVWRDSNEKTYTDGNGNKSKRVTLSHYAAIVNDIGEIKPLCFHRNIVPVVQSDPLNGTYQAKISAPLAMVETAEAKVAAEIARTLMFGAADTITDLTFRYGDKVRVIGVSPADGYEFRFLTKSLLLDDEIKVAHNKIGTLPITIKDTEFFKGSKVRNLRLSPKTSTECFGIAKMLVEMIGIEGYYRAPLSVRDMCRAMTRYYADQKTTQRLLTTTRPQDTGSTSNGAQTLTKTATKGRKKPVAGTEIAEGVKGTKDNAKSTVDAGRNTADTQLVTAGVDPANASRQVVAALPYGNGSTL